jgi:hypothetical protein
MVKSVYQDYLIKGAVQMINVFTTEYLMIRNQIEIENEARHTWKWMSQQENNKTHGVVNATEFRPTIVCCQPACC